MDGLTRRLGRTLRARAESAPLSGAAGRLGDLGGSVADLRRLISAVESEVIPRLLLTHRIAPAARARSGLTEVEQLCGLTIESDTRGALALIDRLVANGVGIESIYIDLLGATARLLGEMWEQDRIGFMDVTVGLCTLHQVLFRLGLGRDDLEPAEATAGRALFAPVPGETHVFGALIVAKMFARSGWRTWTELSLAPGQILALVRENAFDVIGISMSADRHLETMRETVAALRAVFGEGAGPVPTILVGGNAFDRNPGWAEAVGADGTAPDPATAVRLAEEHLDRRKGVAEC